MHSFIVFFVPMFVYEYAIIRGNGWNGDLWMLSVTSFTSVYFMVTLKLMNFIRFYTHYHLIAILFLSFFIYYAYVWITNYTSFSYTYATIVVLH